MDYTKTIMELRQKKADIVKAAEDLVSAGKYADAQEQTAAIDAVTAEIATVEALADRSRKMAEPTEPEDKGQPRETGKVLPFASLGEQLQAVRNAGKGIMDKRLLMVNDAVQGAGTGSGADGGYAIQTDFAGAIMDSCIRRSELLSRVDTYTVSANSNSARWLMVNETDVSSAVFGGVQMYWASEGATVKDSKPGFREMKMDLEKMMGFAYATDELLQDAEFMSGFFGTAFSLAADRLLTAGIISGDGVGKPLGMLNSKALIVVDKTANQPAGTLTGANILKMQGRSMPQSRRNLLWIMHPDLEEQLPYLAITQGDQSKFLWNPEGGLGAFDSQRVLNKPVTFEDSCSAVGNVGDIILADPMQYMMLKKGAAKQDWSMHVEFLTDQQCFRIIYRMNGAPKVESPVTIKNSSKTRSPFVTLAARA